MCNNESCRKIYTINPSIQNESEIIVTKQNKSLHGSLKWVLFLAQCFGQMPVLGITESDSSSLKFSWRSWRTFYCILNCIGIVFISLFYINRVVNGEATLSEYISLVFHFTTFVVTLSFLKLAIEWPQLMRKWSRMEFSMRNYGWPQNLHTRIALISATVLTTATIEYTLTRVSGLLFSIRCKSKEEDLFRLHCTKRLYEEVFSVLNYAPWKCLLLQIENILVTFAWSFNDLFIMLMSTALALRFQQITIRLRLLQSHSKADNITVWQEIREDYNRLSRLTQNLDNALSYITLTSFASNLFFILVQLFNSLRNIEGTLEKTYFFFSFGFLILRTIYVCLYGGWIYDESKEPLAILNSVSSDVYNAEIKRFIEQIKFDTVALTGKNFFYVTRGLVLSMAGAIVTYELVLLQLNESILKERVEQVENSTGAC